MRSSSRYATESRQDNREASAITTVTMAEKRSSWNIGLSGLRTSARPDAACPVAMYAAKSSETIEMPASRDPTAEFVRGRPMNLLARERNTSPSSTTMAPMATHAMGPMTE
jgi:hypothetical protein